MLREEAIEIINRENDPNDKKVWELFPEYREALDMAIQALSQEPCTDAMSREAVYRLVDDIIDNLCENSLDLGALKSWGREQVMELPSVTQKSGKWIPVNERLPEDKTYVLTTIKVPNRIAHARSGWYEGGFFHNDNGDTWKAMDMEVKAWMPLPIPYKAESENKE